MKRSARWIPWALAAGAAAALWTAGGAASAPPAADSRRHVILISIDGFGADSLEDPRLPVPHIRRLAAEGASAGRMTVSTPSVTWPNHTTLVTGVAPARHGVIANGAIERGPGPLPFAINPRRSKEELCRVPTLYDAAARAGLKTAEINWPVTRGAASLTWSFPDYPDAIEHTTPALLGELDARGILVRPTEQGFRAMGQVARDHVWTQAAAHVIRRHRPHLLLLHLLNTDAIQHAHGPLTAEAFTALSLADRQVGDILQAVRDAGLRDRTAVVITSDHGFMRVTRQVLPNARFRSRGLNRPAADGSPATYQAQSISEGGSALVYVPMSRVRPELVEQARAALAGLEGLAEVVSPPGYPELGIPRQGQSPQAPDLLLRAADGYAFSNAETGDEVVVLPRPIGTHGYAHTNPRMDAVFVAGGAGIRRGARLERIRNVDVAPTLARLLGVSLPDADGAPLRALLAED